MEVFFFQNTSPNSSSSDRFTASDQKEISWFYFISSTSLVMSIMALLFRWREEPNEEQNIFISYFTMFNSMYSSISRVH
jgi:hypothetical protein